VSVVDCHAHVIVPGLGAEVVRDERGQVVRFRGREIRSARREFEDVERILEEQDRAGVDVIVLCPWVDLCCVEVERQNEALAGYAGERVLALGTVDPTRPEQLVELMQDGRLAGVEIPASPGGAFVFVHPGSRGFALPALEEHYLWNTVGNPIETAASAAHMLAAGVLDAHPRLNVLLAHGGGVLPALRGRLAHEQEIHPPGRDVYTALRRFHVDTVVHDTHVLRDLVDFFGAERVLLGSDYPFDMGSERPAEIVRRLGLPRDGEDAILGGNALRLLSQVSPA
jgi:aminocarboxymuconate-semialdehyde decarboxylase